MNDYIIYIAAGLLVALIVVAVLFQRERNSGFSLEYKNRQLEKERETLQREKENLIETNLQQKQHIKELQEEEKRLSKLYKLFNSLYQIAEPNHKARDLGVADFDKQFSFLERRTVLLSQLFNSLNEWLPDSLEKEKKHAISLETEIKELYEEKKRLTKKITDLNDEADIHLSWINRLMTALSSLFPKNSIEDEPEQPIPENNELRVMQLEGRIQLLNNTGSIKKAIPYMAAIMADYSTYELKILAKKLEWGHSQERAKKVESLIDLRRETKAALEKSYESRYQLAYLLELYPGLQDVLDTEFSDLPTVEISELNDYDRTKDWLTKEEYQQLGTTERNQLALDRYVQSKRKTKWQIGRDYELYVAYKYSLKGYDVDTFGSYMGLEDLGRDLICTKYTETLIVQCKYWGEQKTIHEKHITQLYGTVVAYCIEHHLPRERVKGILVTNIHLSETARQFADYLQILYKEGYPFGEYPRIKCNIGRDELGYQTKIYHLPFDQQYDNTKISEPGECYAFTVAEAEAKGFRRAFKWFG